MRILLAIESSDYTKQIFNKTLRWAARLGYDLRVFVPADELATYQENADDANYKHFLDLSRDQFIDAALFTPESYAKTYSYDLILNMDDDIGRPIDPKNTMNVDRMVVEFAALVGKTRVLFGKKPAIMEKEIANGIVMQRVNHERSA